MIIDWLALHGRWVFLISAVPTLVLLGVTRGPGFYLLLVLYVIPNGALGIRRDHLLRRPIPGGNRADDRERKVVALVALLGGGAWLILCAVLAGEFIKHR